MIKLFHQVSQECSRITTELYSTSFSSSIRLLHKDLRTPIFNIYGFVRFADEIVDTFHEFDKVKLLADFKKATYEAIEQKISLNPILHSFQLTVNQYNIDHLLIDAFLKSMEMDLGKKQYDRNGYEEYIYGSAEVVGLVCLYVFCNGDKNSYEQLKPYACSLGSAFQKVNFLRDLKADFEGLDRMYLIFDRLYFYGDNRPIHISYNYLYENKKEIVEMRLTETGRLVPKKWVDTKNKS